MSRIIYQRERRKRLIAEGLCPKCAKQRDTTVRLICNSCWSKTYYRYTPEKHIDRKIKCFEAYGGCFCSCCGQGNHAFLAIDHINDDGAQHRKSISHNGRSGGNIYTWLSARNYPSGFRVLCHNCNFGRYVNGGICPYQKPKVAETR